MPNEARNYRLTKPDSNVIPSEVEESEIFSQVLYCRGYSGEEPPLPIPNREVKLTIADGTAPPGGRVGSCGSLECRTSCDARHSSFMAGGHKPKTKNRSLKPFPYFPLCEKKPDRPCPAGESLRSERKSAVMGPKGGTMTAKTAENAAMGPEDGTMTAPAKKQAPGEPGAWQFNNPVGDCYLVSKYFQQRALRAAPTSGAQMNTHTSLRA